MVADGVPARLGLRSRYQKHPLGGSGRERRVVFEPMAALLIPILDGFLNGVAEFGVIVEGNVRWVIRQRRILILGIMGRRGKIRRRVKGIEIRRGRSKERGKGPEEKKSEE